MVLCNFSYVFRNTDRYGSAGIIPSVNCDKWTDFLLGLTWELVTKRNSSSIILLLGSSLGVKGMVWLQGQKIGLFLFFFLEHDL